MPRKGKKATAHDAEGKTDAPDTDATDHNDDSGDLDAYAKAVAERMPAFTQAQRERLALILRQTEPPPTE